MKHLIIKNYPDSKPEFFLDREWLSTNGLGGYSSGTILGVNTRRDHGIFVDNVGAPWGRIVMMANLLEEAILDAKVYKLSGLGLVDKTVTSQAHELLEEFRLEHLVPIWVFKINDTLLEKKIFMPLHENMALVQYKIIKGRPLELLLKPHFSMHVCHRPSPKTAELLSSVSRIATGIEARLQNFDLPLRCEILNKDFEYIASHEWVNNVYYRTDEERGHDAFDKLFTPGYFKISLSENQAAQISINLNRRQVAIRFEDYLFSNTQRLEKLMEVPEISSSEFCQNLGMATDQFLIIKGSTQQILSNTHSKSIIAGYHWFMDWGRDSMISLEGLALCTKRFNLAKDILSTLSKYTAGGLLFNNFAETQSLPSYNSVDASLWFFHALERYYRYTNDLNTLKSLMPLAESFINCYLNGTVMGIKADVQDGLVSAESQDCPLTWMDAQLDDKIFTPRRGKPVEIQALWFNALSLMCKWAQLCAYPVGCWKEIADLAQKSFNEKYWYEKGKYLFDVIDAQDKGDNALRPNQIFSISLDFPILSKEKWNPVVESVETHLLTDLGLRSLSPGCSGYRPHYKGSRHDRDAAYHQGAVWPWLIGHFIDAWLKCGKDPKRAGTFLEKFEIHLKNSGIGSISEIFDGDFPHIPRGCIAQAWSVAEILRSAIRLQKI